MPFFVWTDDLSVKVRVIDDQHKKLFRIINTLHEAMREGRGRQKVEETLEELVDYTVYHFGIEEKYMQQVNYPDYYNHKAQHDAFAKKIAAFRKAHEKNQFGLSNELMLFLRDWLTNHIMGTDKLYSEMFVRAGIT